MELRIGVVRTAKELSLELDASADDIVATIDAALGAGSAVCWFTDAKGKRFGIPADKIAYVEIDEDGSSKRVGFGR